ncbi:hypothetical protein GTU71_02490 [Rathayibacter sp. VKM Ac-2762]|uniref:hypothetical protein n=1 Tax=Rathayibacter sp. VKM Ac-2762 TaxID=2609254 RepID=UPI00132E7410|nr:hypothetical protein [Rathayibacter sp. VKM Ac-2762]QHF19837.1 hypothetical protein GTU71_02490 [Rathayibacter sp. VKM Ac-2762]
MTTDNDNTMFWEDSAGGMAAFPREQYQRDATRLFELIITAGADSSVNVSKETRRIFDETSADYLLAVGTTVAGTFAGFSLTHPNTFHVTAALINFGAFLTTFRALVPPAPYPTSTAKAA